HIKDTYYFEVPKPLWRSKCEGPGDFPELWVELDPDFQRYEAGKMVEWLEKVASKDASHPDMQHWLHEWESWTHQSGNHGKPFNLFLESQYAGLKKEAGEGRDLKPFLDKNPSEYSWFALKYDDAQFRSQWKGAKQGSGDINGYLQIASWSPEKIDGYNKAISGKILIPQPFGKLRNFYEPESGFCISKFMIVELVVALILVLLFGWLAAKTTKGGPPKGRLWNLLEVFVVFIRDQVARPAIGGHDADKFVPLLLTMFFFVLGCNLMGMIPWVGAPTGAFGTTLAMALVTFSTVCIAGMAKFGFLGFFKNQVPSMDLPLPIAVVVLPMLFAIEILGLLIKHLVLAVRLLANMVAGHLVILAIMTMAFSAEGAVGSTWFIAAPISLAGTTLFNLLELFVAFLQAYVFTFLSALFIGAAVHHH
ncbi:MAG: F-type H+-transporting ATPase subunit a, partial [Pirellulaceae bacterium]